MKTRDYDYIETRLLGALPPMEAYDRLIEVGKPELAQKIMEATQGYMDALRDVRREIQGQRGTK